MLNTVQWLAPQRNSRDLLSTLKAARTVLFQTAGVGRPSVKLGFRADGAPTLPSPGPWRIQTLKLAGGQSW